MAVLTIARLTIREVSRRKLLLALIVVTIVTIGLTGWAFDRIAHSGGPRSNKSLDPATLRLVTSQLLILLMFMFSGVTGLTAIMVAAVSVAGDIESGVVLALLPRPIRRSDLILGKWLGLAAVLAVYTVVGSGLELLVAGVITGYQAPHPLWLFGYLFAEAVVLLTLALLFSTRLSAITGGIVAVVAFLMAWMGGVAGAVGVALQNQAVIDIGRVSRLILPSDGLWRGSIYSLEPSLVLATMKSSVAAESNPFAAVNPPPAAYLAWVALWLAGVLALSIWSFKRREL